MDDPKEYIEKLEERIIDLEREKLKWEDVARSALDERHHWKRRAEKLEAQLAALQHTGQAMAMVPIAE